MINQRVIEILNQIENAGFEAYIVGGAVRDLVLKVEPHDWDITTNATPEQIKQVFNRTIDSGMEFGTITAIVDGEGFEITTYRTDGKYTDNRKPDQVKFTSSILEDLKRRDFTMNAMACDKNGKIIDPFGGQKDLKDGVIRAVGDPSIRIQEDALRMLRAIRFSAKFGFSIEDTLYEAIKQNADLIKNVSFERIESEVTKIITSNHPEKFLDLYNTGITQYILPEFDEQMHCEQNTIWHDYNVGIHTIEAMKNIENNKILRWTMLLHDVGKPACKTTDEKGQDHFFGHPEKGKEMAHDILKRFKMPNKEISEIENFILYHDLHIKKAKKMRVFAAKYGRDFVNNLYKIQKADIAGQSDYRRAEKEQEILDMKQALNGVIDDGTAISLKELKVNGNDLLSLGLNGKTVGKILGELYELALGNPEMNQKDKLMNCVEKYLKQAER